MRRAAEDGDAQRMPIITPTYLRASVAVFAAFKEEIVERNISNAMFPRANRGVETAFKNLEDYRADLIRAMGCSGGCQ
jgi:hypothetical protein